MAVGVGTVPIGVFNQADVLFPNDFSKMPGGMARVINAEVAFHLIVVFHSPSWCTKVPFARP
jgi:hypothetical protein